MGITYFDGKSIVVGDGKPIDGFNFYSGGNGGYALTITPIDDLDITPNSGWNATGETHNYEDLPKEENDKYFSVFRFVP